MSTSLSLEKQLSTSHPLGPADAWRRVAGDWVLVGGAAAVCHAISAVTGLVLRWLLDPAQMGIWQGLKLLLGYGNYAGLGASKGAAREWTVARGSGRLAPAKHSLNVAHAVNSVTSALYALALTTAGAWIWWRWPARYAPLWGLGLVAVGAMTLIQRRVTYRVTILRAERRFAATARLALLEATLTLAVCASATWLFGLAGLLAGTCVVLCASLVWLHCNDPVDLKAEWESPEALRLVRIGAPVLLAGVASSLMRSLDRWMVLGYLGDGEYQLGCYSAALMVTTQMYGLANILSTVMGPRYGESFGRSGNRREVALLAARASELHAGCLALLGAVAITIAPALLTWLLPAYEEGIGAMVWLVPGVIALGMALPASQYLVAVGLQNRVLAALGVAIVAAAIGNHIALRSGWGLEGVAGATSVAYGIYYVILMGLSLWRELDAAAKFRYAATGMFLLLPAVGLALTTTVLFPGSHADGTIALLSTAAVLCVWCLAIAACWHYSGWSELWRKDVRR